MKKAAAFLLLACVFLWRAPADEGEWTTDFSKAQVKAKAEKKMVLLDFNGSDWCPPCKALRRNVFNSKVFNDFARNNLVLVDVDFPHGKRLTEEVKKANSVLQEKYNVDPLPTVIILSSDGKELKKIEGYGGESAEDFVAELAKLKKEG